MLARLHSAKLQSAKRPRCVCPSLSTEFSTSARGLIDELVRARLLIVSQNRVNFAHDLYGDWARRQVLAGHSADLSSFILPRINSPLWHKPLRLYALDQLEHGSGVDAWERDSAAFSDNSAEAHLASDLFLEALVFAAEPKPLLEQLWPSFSENSGALLSRFLRRFQYAASVPDEFFLNRARSDGDRQAIETAAAIREPLIERWPP